MALISTRTKWTRAFEKIIPRWQEIVAAAGSKHFGLEAMSYEKAGNGGGHATNTNTAAIVRPSFSDFVCDVELNVAAALKDHPKHAAYFKHFYRGRFMQLDEVPPSLADLDQEVRELVGKRFIQVGISPLHTYMEAKDVRSAKAS